MAPGRNQKVLNEKRNNVDNQSKEPRDCGVRSDPEEPCLDILVDVSSMLGWVGLIPDKVDNERRRNDDG